MSPPPNPECEALAGHVLRCLAKARRGLSFSDIRVWTVSAELAKSGARKQLKHALQRLRQRELIRFTDGRWELVDKPARSA